MDAGRGYRRPARNLASVVLPAGSGLRSRAALWAMLTAWLVAVAVVTLHPAPASAEVVDLVARVTAWLTAHGVPLSYEVVEAGANVVMFIPLGVLGTLLARPADADAAGPSAGPSLARALLRAAAWGAALSTAIEVTQLVWLPSRVPTVQDVVMNTTGAVLGAWAVSLSRAWSMGRRRPQVAADGVRQQVSR
jgi:VanZ family protein